MKKDETRDAANAAFRKYARLRLFRLKCSPFLMTKLIRRVGIGRENALDLLAVYDTLRFLGAGEDDTLRVLYAVFFYRPTAFPVKNEVSNRIRRYAADNFTDERTVYRRLDAARKIYSKIRAGYGK